MRLTMKRGDQTCKDRWLKLKGKQFSYDAKSFQLQVQSVPSWGSSRSSWTGCSKIETCDQGLCLLMMHPDPN